MQSFNFLFSCFYHSIIRVTYMLCFDIVLVIHIHELRHQSKWSEKWSPLRGDIMLTRKTSTSACPHSWRQQIHARQTQSTKWKKKNWTLAFKLSNNSTKNKRSCYNTFGQVKKVFSTDSIAFYIHVNFTMNWLIWIIINNLSNELWSLTCRRLFRL